MSKRNQKNKSPSKQAPKISPNKKAKRRLKTIFRSVAALVVLVLVGGFAFSEFKKDYDTSHDLSVIGQGIPTVVQIHDTTCSLCLKLRSNASSAMAKIADESLLFRVADVSTPEGQRLMRKYDVSKVTLLLFDRDGKMNRSLNGVKDDDLLHQEFLAHINRRANRARTVQPDA